MSLESDCKIIIQEFIQDIKRKGLFKDNEEIIEMMIPSIRKSIRKKLKKLKNKESKAIERAKKL